MTERGRDENAMRLPREIGDFQADAAVIKPLLYILGTEETSSPMTSTSAQRIRALDLLRARSMLRLKDFVAEGIGPETLALSSGRKPSSDRRVASINSRTPK